jgi:YbbR domain-containing protein
MSSRTVSGRNMTRRSGEGLFDNLPVKAVALVFALLFFAYVHGQEDVREKTIAIPLVSLPPADGTRELMTALPPNVHLTLRGPARALTRLVQDGVSPVEVDLRNQRVNKISFPPSVFGLPHEITVVAVDPSELELAWEQIITRVVPLRATVSGEPARGNEVAGPPRFEPAEVTVRGPVSKVEVLQYATVTPFDTSALAPGKYTRRLALSPLVPPNRYLGSETATVAVEVRRRERERGFSNLAVQVVGPSHSSALPRFVDVKVTGPPELLESLSPAQLVPQADLSELGKWNPQSIHGSAVVPVRVPLAGAVVSTQPPTVIVKW